jgi:hypothetical protein
MSEEIVVDRGKSEDKGAALKAQLEAKMESIFDQRNKMSLELAGPQGYWDLYAIGPYQAAGLEPGRLIELGEEATILVVVYLNPNYPPPPAQDTCTNLTQHNDKVELFFFTSNMQTMQPVPDLTHQVCIPTTPGQCWYYYYWTFTPTQPACLYETNICARICNCQNQPLRQFSAFVRWVEDLDYDHLFGGGGLRFDRPIRFMVNDPTQQCDCP